MVAPPTTPSTRRRDIGQKLKALREARRLNQTNLAARLGISQARISLIERGQAALDAGEFLDVLRIFNVPASHFESPAEDQDALALQNALIHLGANHLFANDRIVPDEALGDPGTVIREVLATGTNPRQIAALAPVLVLQFDRLNLTQLWARFVDYGLQQRLGWLLENTVAAIQEASPKARDRASSAQLRKAGTHLRHFLDQIEPQRLSAQARPEDILGEVFSRKTLEEIQRSRSDLSRRWSILTNLHPHDFTVALEAALDTR
jgi:transcriptional regulator with XRE-family HTH domain